MPRKTSAPAPAPKHSPEMVRFLAEIQKGIKSHPLEFVVLK